MIPRKRLDIGWRDLLFGMARCFHTPDRATLEKACRATTASPKEAMCFLSARSGFDLLLQVLQFPKGSEILISAITIPDIVTIIKAHHLIPVPIDLDPNTLHPDQGDFENKITPKTVAVMITHLFGGRVPMNAVAQQAELHNLIVFEDCAQGYWGDTYTGHPSTDVCMFSFGPIKFNTALGGALFFIQNTQLRRKAMQKHATYRTQRNSQFFQRLIKFAPIKILSHPLVYTLFCILCRLLNIPRETIIFAFTRGFSGENLFCKLRQQPSAPLLALLHRRLASDAFTRLIKRRETAQTFRRLISQIPCPGYSPNHGFWIFPILTPNPQKLCEELSQRGFDAHGWPVSLCIINADQTPQSALAIQKHIVFIPIYPGLAKHRINQLAHLICTHELHPADSPTTTSQQRLPFV